MKEVVEILRKKGMTISTMESCTGGFIANEITNIEGASDVLKFSAVTYCNEFKIKMGVDAEVIDKYSVYSIETAREMAKNISKFTKSDLGVGITGKLNRIDKNNLSGADNRVFVSIYRKDMGDYSDFYIDVKEGSRKANKEIVEKEVVKRIIELL